MQQQAKKLTFFSLILFLIACGTESNLDSDELVQNNEIDTVGAESNPSMKSEDSKILERSFTGNLIVAMKNIHENEFNLKVEDIDPVSKEVVNSELLFGNLFNTKQKHLITRRYFEHECFLDVFVCEDDSFRLLFTHLQDDLTFIKDTIFDTNGDGLKDYVVCWYPSAGCCRRNIKSVYLLQQDTISFSNEIEFVNPTFSQKERMVRGVEYGHPEEIGLYKFKWNLNQVDTIEYIYHNQKVNGEFVRVTYTGLPNQKSDSTTLKSLPGEYKNIDDLDWFLEAIDQRK